MRDIDVDAVIELERVLREQAPGPTNPADRVGKLVGLLRKTNVHLTTANAVSLDDEEDKAMDALLECMRIIRGWGKTANDPELVAGIHVVQGFIVQHMLHRLNPDMWSDWFKS